MRRLIVAAVVAAALTLFACHPLPAQNVVRITIADQDFERDEPATLEDALTLIRGETDLLNRVIASYILDGAAAQARVVELLGSISTVAVKAREVVPVAPPIQLPPVTITIPAKFLALGGFAETNPLLLAGPLSFSAGASATINLFNALVLGGDAGFNITTGAVVPIVRVRIESWLF